MPTQFIQGPEARTLQPRGRVYTAVKPMATAFALCLGLAAEGASAGAAKWSSTNFQYLYGDTYAQIGVDGEGNLGSTVVSSSVITLEHVNGWSYGDNFFFDFFLVFILNPRS